MYYRLYAVNNNQKSDVRGYWTDKGKVYKDNIQIKKYTNKKPLYRDIKTLFDNKEKAVFYILGNIAIIEDIQGKKTILRHKQVYRRTRLSSQEVKALLKQYGGITIYNSKKSRGLYHIEIWQK